LLAVKIALLLYNFVKDAKMRLKEKLIDLKIVLPLPVNSKKKFLMLTGSFEFIIWIMFLATN
jgi:hypothetical protein